MQDDTLSPPYTPAKPRSARTMLIVALLAFLMGSALVGWLALRGHLPLDRADAALTATGPAAAPRLALASGVPTAAALGSVETRLALLEDRLSRLDGAAEAASGNAARAESLLIAFAARRLVDRGEPLGYLENPLRLRFGDGQPNAVKTILAASTAPVSLDVLCSDLEALGSGAPGPVADDGTLARIGRELSALFIIRSDSRRAATPDQRLTHAKALLTAGKTDAAIAEVERLPGSARTAAWIAAARRYADVQGALDLIETAAMLEQPKGKGEPGPKLVPAKVLPESTKS